MTRHTTPHARRRAIPPASLHTGLRANPLRPLPVDEADGVIDEVQAWFLAQAERDGWVYTSVLRQLVNKLYRDRDYLEKRKTQGRRTAYDYAVDRDQKAFAWAIRALVRHVPPQEKRRPEPPKPARKPARRLTPAQKQRYAGRPSWNGRPKRDWDGPELPPRPAQVPFADRTGDETSANRVSEVSEWPETP
jgi:hypothetical protein